MAQLSPKVHGVLNLGCARRTGGQHTINDGRTVQWADHVRGEDTSMSMSMRKIAMGLGVLGLFVLLGGGGRPPAVGAQAAKAEFKLKLMGINRTLDPWKLYQDWAQTVEKRTNGRVQFELTSLP